MSLGNRMKCALMGGGIALIALTPLRADPLPGTGDLTGSVSAAKSLGQLTVYALNKDKNVGYMVYVVDGRYRAVDLFPGHYDVTVRGTAGQLNMDIKQQTVSLTVAADGHATADFTLTEKTPPPTYVGGMTYPDAKIEPFDKIYPAGQGRDVMERICFGCHTVQVYPYNVNRVYASGRPPHDKEGWVITVGRMAHGNAFGAFGKPSYFDPALLKGDDEKAVVDYLTRNFGVDSAPRAVKQESEPKLDTAVLAKAEFVEYRFPNDKPDQNRYTHTIDFDPTDGHIFVMDRGGSRIVEVNPETGDRIEHTGQGAGEYLQVDVDGTVWYGGLGHLDPKTGLFDKYRLVGNKVIPVSSMVFDSNGDLWLSELASGGLAKWDRKTDTVSWWDVPILRARPYGITLDHNDKVWFAGYHDSAIASFDPKTQEFRNYPLIKDSPSNIRRTNADSKNFMWAATWAHPHPQEGGSLFRVNPDTGEVVQHKLGIAFSNPYDCDIDDHDNVWVATDNHVLMFDQTSNKFTLYPVPERTDLPKLSLTRDGAVWFSPRNAGQSGGYGGAAAVLYPDKDKIKSFAAYYSENSERNRRARYKGPVLTVTGVTKLSPAAPQNPGAYEAMLGANNLKLDKTDTEGAPKVLKGGASAE